MAARVLFGLSVGGFWTFAVPFSRGLVADVSGSRATALVISGVSIGTIVGVPAGTALAESRGWYVAFAVLACLSATTVATQSMLLVRTPGGPPIQLRSMLGLFRNPFLRFGFLATALTAASHFAAYTYLQPLLGMKLGLAPGQVTLVLLAYGVAGIGGTFAAERLSIYDLRRTFAAAALFLGGAVGTAACAPHSGVAVAAVVLWGAAFGAIPVCSQLWTFQAAPQSFEPASAISMTVFQISLSAGSFAGGQLVNLGSVVPAFLLATLLALCCVILLHMTPSPQ